MGDVSLETGGFYSELIQQRIALLTIYTEKFEQAISDYTAALKLKTDILPLSSRQIAEAHYKLSIVLDMTSGRLGDAVVHVERALESVEARLAELRNVLSGQGVADVKAEAQNDVGGDESGKGKGKGKAKASALVAEDSISRLTRSQMENEVKDLEGLREDLALKVSLADTLIWSRTDDWCLYIADRGTQDEPERPCRVRTSDGSARARC